MLRPDDAAFVLQATEEPALPVAGIAVGIARGLAQDADLTCHFVIPEQPVVGNVAENQHLQVAATWRRSVQRRRRVPMSRIS
jgi:hypothetical protein